MKTWLFRFEIHLHRFMIDCNIDFVAFKAPILGYRRTGKVSKINDSTLLSQCKRYRVRI